jgi:hypothetical protein
MRSIEPNHSSTDFGPAVESGTIKGWENLSATPSQALDSYTPGVVLVVNP